MKSECQKVAGSLVGVLIDQFGLETTTSIVSVIECFEQRPSRDALSAALFVIGLSAEDAIATAKRILDADDQFRKGVN